MSELPSGWAEARIGDLADLKPKQEFDDEAVAGFVPMSHAPTNFRDKLRFDERPWGEIKKAYTNFKDGDVIFAKVTPCFENGKAAFVEGLPNGIGAGSSEFFVLRPSCDEVSAKYLLALVKSHDFLREGAENMTGAVGLRRVPKQFVENYPVLVPPAAEQARIAAKLDELLAQVDTLKARIDGIPALLKRFRQSVITAAISGALTNDWDGSSYGTEFEVVRWSVGRRQQKVEETKSHEVVVDIFPKRWKVSCFGDVFLFLDYRGKTPEKSLFGKRLISAKNIKMGFLSDEPVEYLSDEDYSSWMTRGFPALGDIFLVTEGATMGCVALNDRVDDFALAQRTITLQPRIGINTRFYLYFMLSTGFQRVMELNATGTAATGIKAAKLRSLPLPLPSLAEQTEIVRRVEQLFAFADQLEAKVKDAKTRIDRLTQSILAKAFRGELVPQDPDDEPASELLARIQAQRAAAPKAKRGRKASA